MCIELIVNPVANRGRSTRIFRSLQGILKRKGINYSYHFTDYPGHATELTSEMVTDESLDAIFVVGGDGTYNEVVNGLLDSGIPLGLLPGGSCNDFIKDIGEWRDFDSFLKAVMKGKTRTVDAGMVNGRVFLNNMGVGFDAQVIEDMIKRNLKTNLGYVIMVIKNLFQFEDFDASVFTDEINISDRMIFLTVNNGSTYGGGFRIAPHADFNDGLLDVCLIRKIGKMKFLLNFPKVYSGTHLSIDEVEYWKCSKVEIELSRKLAVQIDGDLLPERMDSLDIKIIPDALEVFTFE